MKKALLLLIFPILLGCSNLFTTDTNVSISANLHESRALTEAELGTITSIKLWISDPGVNYLLVDPAEYNATQELVPEDPNYLTLDLDTTLVRKIESTNSNNITFDIRNDVTKVFTIKVTYSSGRIFMGTKERAINPYVTEILIDIYETATSQQMAYFDDLDAFLDDNWSSTPY